MQIQNIEQKIKERAIDFENLSTQEIEQLAQDLIQEHTQELQKEMEEYLAQKEILQRKIEKKAEELQEVKYTIFHTLEKQVEPYKDTLIKLHQIKLQSIDLYNILSEMVESALITALEKDHDSLTTETISEVIKEITFETIKEGSLNTIRVRKILSTILATAIDIAEATPNKAQAILQATLKGMRSGLIQSIERFKKRIAFMPIEAKHILIEDYDTIIEDLNQTDTLFSQVIITQASHSSSTIRELLITLNKEMRYDLEELIVISKETAEIIKERFADFAKKAAKKADFALQSHKAQEAKEIGKQALEVAREMLGSALKSAKNVIDKN